MMNASEVAVALSVVADEDPSPTEILMAGLFYVGIDQNRQTKNNLARKNNWFKAFYGVEPATIADHFSEMKSIDANITCKNYLLTMNWLFLYDTYPILSGRWKYSEEFIGRTVMRYGMLMATVGRRKIVFELEHKNVKFGRTYLYRWCQRYTVALDYVPKLADIQLKSILDDNPACYSY